MWREWARDVEGDGEEQREQDRVPGQLKAEVDRFLNRDGGGGQQDSAFAERSARAKSP